ncbi:MAG: TIGR01212 family radical SAM protein [Thermoguttaceae bacterium]
MSLSKPAITEDECDWKKLGYRYFPLGVSMRREFGFPVWKISVDAGFSCPNVDGTVGYGGCVFCNTHSFSPSRALFRNASIQEQLNQGIKRLRRRHKVEKFIAYFQPSTNTYDTPDELEKAYLTALSHPDIVGLIIGTRPDVLPEPVLDMIAALARNYWIQLEIGLQSIHAKSLEFLRRGHNMSTFEDAVERASQRKLRLGVHLILGIPGENRNDMIETANVVAKLRLACVKLHNLYIVRETQLALLWESGQIVLPSLEEYAEMAVDVIERLPPNVVIERISSEADEPFLLAPAWTAIKHAARNAIDQEFRRRGSFQGTNWN